MLSETLKNIEKYLLEHKPIPIEKIKDLLKILTYFKLGSYIHPFKIKDDLDLTNEDINNLFGKLVSYGVIKPAYQLYCPSCGWYSEYPVDTLEEIDMIEICSNDECNYKFKGDKFKYIVLQFKVIVE